MANNGFNNISDTGDVNISDSFNNNASESRLAKLAALIGIITGIIAILVFFGYPTWDKVFPTNGQSSTKAAQLLIEGTWTDGQKNWVFRNGYIYINGRSQMKYTLVDSSHMLIYELGKTGSCEFSVTQQELKICTDSPIGPLITLSKNTSNSSP